MLTILSTYVIITMVTKMSTFEKGVINMNLGYLNYKIEEIKIPITTIAEKMGISRQSLYLKMKGNREFKTSEIAKLCDILRLTNDEKNLIFFANEGDKSVN